MPVISATEGRAYEFEPNKTALIIVDMQRDFIESGGACDMLGADVKLLQSVVPHVCQLLAFARKVGLRVVHTRYGFKRDLSNLSPAIRMQSRAAGGEYGTPGPLGLMFVEGEAGFGIIPALMPLSNELVVNKPTFGVFAGSDLHSQLSQEGIDHLIFCGVTTQCCVESSIREAVDRNYFVLTVHDACAAFEPALHEATFRAIASEAHLFGWIASTMNVVASLPDGIAA